MGTLSMKSLLCHITFLLVGSCQGNIETNCNNNLSNKIISFENSGNSEVYPHYSRSGRNPRLGTTTGEYGGYITFTTMKPGWEDYYMFMDQKTLGIFNGLHQLAYYKDITYSDPGWKVQFDVLCEECDLMNQCFVVNRWKHSMQDENYGRMAVQEDGSVGFVYGKDAQSNAAWKLRIHDPATICPEEVHEGFDWKWLFIIIPTVLVLGFACFKLC